MLARFKHTHILLILSVTLAACRQTRYVPSGKFLLKDNIITISGTGINRDDLTSIIRQQPNFKTFGLKLKLFAYNLVDSTSVANKRFRENQKLRAINKKKLERQNLINQKRKSRAIVKGKHVYTEKIIVLKDTTNPHLFLREWFKYKIGEKPIVFDSILLNKSLDQLGVFLKNKGYYKGSVTGNVRYLKRRGVKVHYNIMTGPRFNIDSVYVICSNERVQNEYLKYVKISENGSLLGQPFDKNYLNDYRESVARYMRDNSFYGFSSSHISYIADTTYETMSVSLGLIFTDRQLKSDANRDSIIKVPHKFTYIRKVFFHIADTTYFSGNFKKTVEDMGLTLLDQQFVRTIDTFQYAQIKKAHHNELDSVRMATFTYNGRLSIDPGILELQNYLEPTNYYKEYYVERSYTRLLQLGLFQVIKPVIEEIPGSPYLDVHYYLVPSQKQNFSFEPRATNSNGFLGVSSSINYSNKNLFGGAEKLTFSIGGGFESQPPVFDQTLNGEKIQKAGRSFNTFEIGPTLKMDLPGLFPTRAILLSKRHRPRTIVSSAYNYQKRSDFVRHVFQLNYSWKFYVGKTQIFQVGLPGISAVKFVNIVKSDAFTSKLNQLNDLFLRNAYSNQFIWEDFKFSFEYNNKDRTGKGLFNFYLNSSFDPAGNLLSLFKKYQDTLSNGQRNIFGVAYSQFSRLDNEIICSYPLYGKRSIHGRFQMGIGIPYGNTTTSLPYDYAFFAGGANDNRGWRARALAPGSYKYYLDTNRTATQISDIRIGASAEFRFSISDLIKGALFFDAGNTWTYNNDINRLGSQFSRNWYREIALSTGVGLRFDLDFFILRLDMGIPLTNPAMPIGERWIFNKNRTVYISEGINTFGINNYKKYLPKPYTPCFHFGIGFPF
jgi:outer membrane protein insertion porin family